MNRNEMIEVMQCVAGEWSTVRIELADVIKETVDTELEYDSYSIEDEGDDMWLELELDDKDIEIRFRIENAGQFMILQMRMCGLLSLKTIGSITRFTTLCIGGAYQEDK